MFTPDPWGNDPIWRAYFSNGLKPPTCYIFSHLSRYEKIYAPNWKPISPLKMDGWKMKFPFGMVPFSGDMLIFGGVLLKRELKWNWVKLGFSRSKMYWSVVFLPNFYPRTLILFWVSAIDFHLFNHPQKEKTKLGGGFKYCAPRVLWTRQSETKWFQIFFFSPLFGEDFQFD